MAEQYDPFFPQHVDESIEQLTSIVQANDAGQVPILPEAHLVANLQKFYGPEHKRHQQALQRVEDRLVEHYTSQAKRSATLPLVAPVQQRQLSERWNIQKGKFNKMQYKHSSSATFVKLGRSLALVAVVLVMLGSAVVILNYAHQRTTEPGSTPGASTSRKATPTPKKPIGTTIYTTPVNTSGFGSFSWSPDSKRVATMINNTVQIWDATTGKHKVTVLMPGGTNEWPWSLDWSHTSQQVAIGTTQHLLIVDGLTGHILRTYASNTGTLGASPNTPATSGISYLTSQFPAGGGFGYRATAWSPTGHLVASALSFGATGEVQVLNAQTGALSFTLNLSNASYNVGAVSWSSDGRYIAGSTWNTQGADPTQPNNMVVVWSVSTHQIVFQHLDNMTGSGAPVVWQPYTHNIAYGGSISSGGNMVIVLKIWDVTTGRQVKQYAGAGVGGLTWSPDGKYLAYSGYSRKESVSAVIILNVATDRQVYAYKSHKNTNTSLVAWSPDGRYIISDEVKMQMPIPGKVPGQGSVVAHVWLAE